MDLIHPPFWWWFWATGLAFYHGGGLAYDTVTFWWVQGVIQIGYWVRRLIEGVFMCQNGMMHIHVWRRFDSRFRLISAAQSRHGAAVRGHAVRSARPGLIVVAWWTAISCAVHAIRAVQAWRFRARGGTIVSWLSGHRRMNATIEKFGWPATLVREFEHWVVLARPAQPALGSLVLAAKERRCDRVRRTAGGGPRRA